MKYGWWLRRVRHLASSADALCKGFDSDVGDDRCGESNAMALLQVTTSIYAAAAAVSESQVSLSTNR